jgi:DNA-binding HxlR family transcriptional regulator
VIDPADAGLVRYELLRDLGDAGRYGLPARILRTRLLGTFAPDATESEVERELFYLEKKGLVERREGALSPGTHRWHITGAGLDAVERGNGGLF